MNPVCPIIELRQYTLHPSTRETLVRVFEEHFIEAQERYGMRILGQFRDLADPDRFVWVRDFPDMEARTRALEGFYSGPVWKEHSPVANATMIDHTNVLLLRPAGPGLGFRFDPRLRPPPDAAEIAGRHRRRDDLSPRRPGLAGHRGVAVRGERARDAARPPRHGAGAEPGGAASRPRGRECIRDIHLLPERGRLRPSTATSSIVSHHEHLLLEPTRRSFLRHR